MSQTVAIFVDAYRELNARKMFWITLILSGVFIGAFGLLGVDAQGWTIFGFHIPIPMPQFAYKWLFSYILIGLWVKLGALILALISTASIFPELISSGSIDLYVSKPISRLRLFLTKYATGLVFVLLQTSVFAIGSFLVFGFRLHDWRPSLFLMLPLVVCLFSYLFCFCTLMGVLTRSTIASVLLTVLFWLICFGLNLAESSLSKVTTMTSAQARGFDRQVRQADAELRRLKDSPSIFNAFHVRERAIENRRDKAQLAAAEARTASEKLGTFHRIAYYVATFIPKTGETVDLLDRKIFTDADLAELRDRHGENGPVFDPDDDSAGIQRPPTTNPTDEQAREEEQARTREERRQIRMEAAEETQRMERSRSIPWILGTSLGFEVVLLTWAAWVFCRRDY